VKHPGGRKHTDIEVAARREAVVDLLSRGEWTTANIAKLAREHGVSTNMVYDDRKTAMASLRDALLEPDPTDRKVRLLAKSEALYRSCLAMGHTATAARLLDFEARVTGAHEPLKVDVRHTIERLPDEDLARQILDPEAVRWARAVLEAAGEKVPGVLEVAYQPAQITEDP
jgi:transposase-like protein